MVPSPTTEEEEGIEIDVSFEESDVIALTERDLVLVDEAREPARPRRAPAASRLSLTDEADVADECLASLAREASLARACDPFLAVAPPSSARAAGALGFERSIPLGKLPVPSVPPRSPRPPASSWSSAPALRLPPVTTPPLPRTSSLFSGAAPRVARTLDVSEVIETLPVPMKAPFARTLDVSEVIETLPVPMKAPFARTPSASSAARKSFPPDRELAEAQLRAPCGRRTLGVL